MPMYAAAERWNTGYLRRLWMPASLEVSPAPTASYRSFGGIAISSVCSAGFGTPRAGMGTSPSGQRGKSRLAHSLCQACGRSHEAATQGGDAVPTFEGNRVTGALVHSVWAPASHSTDEPRSLGPGRLLAAFVGSTPARSIHDHARTWR